MASQDLLVKGVPLEKVDLRDLQDCQELLAHLG